MSSEDDVVAGDRSERIDQAVALYLAAADRGEPIPRDRWLADHPDLARDLAACLDDLQAFRSLLPVGEPVIAADTEQTGSLVVDSDAVTMSLPSTVPNAPDRGKSTDPTRPGTRIRYFGDYELTKILGRGGMGEVHLARQISLDRSVALKMIRNRELDDPDAHRRFRHEAEYIARLDHPNILTILEVGEYKGCRYFTMPWIDRGSLADHLPRFKADPRSAVRLMIVVSEAIDHAHRRGILHRDLKPANILIDSSDRPHVADFGLAKQHTTGPDETAPNAILGTPAYMAPEQATGQRAGVTTATDIYGLGAILYALLTGQAPFPGKSSIEVLRRVVDVPPTSPRQLNPRIDRALAAICMKCLEKNADRRYQTAQAVADDLRRWVEGEPVQARAVGPLTRTWLWCRRRPVQASLSAALFLSWVVGTGVILVSWAEAREQRREIAGYLTRTEDLLKENINQRSRAESVSTFLMSFLQLSTPMGIPDRKATVAELLVRAAPLISENYGKMPDQEAMIRRVMADAFHASGQLAEGLLQIETAHRLHRSIPKTNPEELVNAHQTHALILHNMGRHTEAIGPASRVMDDRIRTRGWDDTKTLDAAILVATLRSVLQQPASAEDLIANVVRRAEAKLPPDHPTLMSALTTRGTIHRAAGRHATASADYRRVHATRLRRYGLDRADTLSAVGNLGGSLFNEGAFAQAEALLKPVIEASEKVLGQDHPQNLAILSNLAASLQYQRKLVEAREVYDRAAERHHATYEVDDPRRIIFDLSYLAHLADRRDFATVRRLAPDIITHLRQIEFDDAIPFPDAQVRLASVLVAAEMFAETKDLCDQALVGYRRDPRTRDKPTDPLILRTRYTRAVALLGLKQFAEVEPIARNLLELRHASKDVIGEAQAQGLLGETLFLRGDIDKSGDLLRQSYQTIKAIAPAYSPARINATRRYVAFLRGIGQEAEADKIEPTNPASNPNP